ncbi:MAG: hypothetical protein AAGI90_00045 [Chlamydiota bacterium]
MPSSCVPNYRQCALKNTLENAALGTFVTWTCNVPMIFLSAYSCVGVLIKGGLSALTTVVHALVHPIFSALLAKYPKIALICEFTTSITLLYSSLSFLPVHIASEIVFVSVRMTSLAGLCLNFFTKELWTCSCNLERKVSSLIYFI